MTKSRAQIKAEFANKGLSITAWAKHQGFTPNMVIAILSDDEVSPRLKCIRGEAHNIAVKLGLKTGEMSREPTRLVA